VIVGRGKINEKNGISQLFPEKQQKNHHFDDGL